MTTKNPTRRAGGCNNYSYISYLRKSFIYCIRPWCLVHRINKKNNSYVIAAASVATLLTFAIVAAAVSNIANTIIPASATTTTTTTTSNDTTTATSPSEIDLSPEPVHQ